MIAKANDQARSLCLGLVLNPWAGIGGSVALKGSDGADIQKQAIETGAKPKAESRLSQFLEPLKAFQDTLQFLCFPGDMGENILRYHKFSYEVLGEGRQQAWPRMSGLGESLPALSSSGDSRDAAREMAQRGVDILLFCGGDGTARDISAALGSFSKQVCLGIPAGVKIQSGVYARTPLEAAELIKAFTQGSSLELLEEEVRDIDEQALREGRVCSKRYSELWVPSIPDLGLALQGSKESAAAGTFSAEEGEDLSAAEALAAEEIAAGLYEDYLEEQNTLWIVGPGKTTEALKRKLSENENERTLLGVDVYLAGQCLAQDVNAVELEGLLDQKLAEGIGVKIFVSPIGGQGCLFGRGNQQLSPKILERVLAEGGHGAFIILATQRKLASLQGKRMFVDTGDAALDLKLGASYKVRVSYEREMLYLIGT